MSQWVYGEGPTPAKIMFVGERPGQEEYRSGRPFSEYGKSGKEIRRYLFNEGIRFEDCYVTNVCKDYIEGNPDPKSAEIERDRPLLIEELKKVKPKFIGAVGRFAAQWFLGNDFWMEALHGLRHRITICRSCGKIRRPDNEQSSEIKERLLEMDGSESTPRQTANNYKGKKVSGLSTSSRDQVRRTTSGTQSRATSQVRASLVRERQTRSRTYSTSTQEDSQEDSLSERTSTDSRERIQIHKPHSRIHVSDLQEVSSCQCSEVSLVDCMGLYHTAFGLHSPSMTPHIWNDFVHFGRMVRGEESFVPSDQYPDAEYTLLTDKFPPFYPDLPLYIDTEGSVENPWCLSFTQEEGKGYVILAKNKSLLKRFAAVIKKLDLEVVCHPVIHDMGVLRTMGVEFDRYRCTMTKAYLNTLVPQGLKPLSRRLCGVVQEEYADVMEQANRDKAVDWLMKAWEWAQANAGSDRLRV